MAKQMFEALAKLIHSLYDNDPKPPLHIGEAMACWTYYAILKEAVALEQIGLNTTVDKELKDVVEKCMKTADAQSKRLKEFMIKEGLPLPPVSEDKPLSNQSDIPLGVKMTDNEIANSVSIKLSSAITTCATSLAQSVRNDVGLMFFEFQTEAMRYSLLLKSVMRKRGWLKIPPSFLPPGNIAFKNK